MSGGTGASLDVLQVNKLYYPQIGGVESVVRTVAEGMAERGHQSRVLASVPRGLGGHERRNGVDVRKVASATTAASVPLAPTFPMHLARAVRDADVVHHHLPNPLGPVSQLLIPSMDAELVVTYHSDIVRQQRALRLYQPVLQRFLDRAERIIVTSPRLLEHSRHLAPVTEKCTVVPLSIDPDEYDPIENARTDLPVEDGEPVVLFVGRLNYYKGVEYLVDAMTDVDATLLIAGDGDRREPLERRARERGVDSKIEFLGFVSDTQLRNCYSAADIFVLPSVSNSEAFGIVQLEAMAHGLPVVNTALPTGVPWVSRDGETGLTVPPEDADALAMAITDLLEDSELRAIYGENARSRVESEFTRTRMLDRIERIYSQSITSG